MGGGANVHQSGRFQSAGAEGVLTIALNDLAKMTWPAPNDAVAWAEGWWQPEEDGDMRTVRKKISDQKSEEDTALSDRLNIRSFVPALTEDLGATKLARRLHLPTRSRLEIFTRTV